MRKLLLATLCLLLTSSCGYRWGRGEVVGPYQSVYVPYVQGDEDGLFTTALIHELAAQGVLVTTSESSADLLLCVVLKAPEDTNVGFIYAPPKKGADQSHIIVANEGRLTMCATITLRESQRGEVVLGPCEVTNSMSYDFEPDLGNVNFHAFALGQLEMHNLAADAARDTLYTRFAHKIVTLIHHAW